MNEDEDNYEDNYEEHFEEVINNMDLYQDVLIIVKKDGETVIIPSYDDKLSKFQYDYMEKILVISEPSFFLRFVMWLELMFKYLYLYIKEQADKYNNQD